MRFSPEFVIIEKTAPAARGGKKRNGVQSDMKQPEKQPGKRKNFHERYFEGYAEQKVLKKNGGYRTQRTYVGTYYRAAGGLAGQVLRRAAYLALYLAAAWLFYWASTRQAPGNASWYGIMLAVICLLVLACTFMPLFSYLIAARNMPVYEYKSGSQLLQKMALGAAAVLWVQAAVAALGALGLEGEALRAQLWSAGGFALAGLALAAVWLLEAHAQYDQLANPNAEKQ